MLEATHVDGEWLKCCNSIERLRLGDIYIEINEGMNEQTKKQTKNVGEAIKGIPCYDDDDS